MTFLAVDRSGAGEGKWTLEVGFQYNSTTVVHVPTPSYIVNMRRKPVLTAMTVTFATLLFWPWLGDPLDYVKLSDRFKTSIPIALVFGQPCQTKTEYGIELDVSPNCYQFDASREYFGLWLYQFEGSNFYEGLTELPLERPEVEKAAWLNYHPEQLGLGTKGEELDQNHRCHRISAFQIRFVGRERKGSGGHFGQWNSEVWPEKIIQAKPVPAPDCENY